MDIHCKADPFSAMHREYAELVYRAKHLCDVAFIPTQIRLSAAVSRLTPIEKKGAYLYQTLVAPNLLVNLF